MRDVLIWRALHEGTTTVERLAELIEELAAADLPARAWFLQGVVPHTTHRSTRVRIAATKALSGAFGTDARKAIAQRLDDNHADVRAAAIDALAACCQHDPAPYACALFHKRVDVRCLALEKAPVRIPVAQQVLLLRDDETKGDVEKMLDKRAQDGAIAPALLVARKLKLMDDAEVTRRLLALPWGEKTSDVLNAMPFAAVVDAHLATPDALRGYLTTLHQSDPLADVLSLLWLDDGGLVATLTDARRKGKLKDPEHRRIAVAAVQVMLTRGAAGAVPGYRMLAFISLAVPVALPLEPDRARRRAALHALPEVADPEVSGKLPSVKQLTEAKGGDPKLLHDAAGTSIDPLSLAGALRLLHEAPYQKLREAVPTADTVKAFWSAPLDSLGIVSMPPRAPADREAYRALVKGIIEAMKTPAPDVVAALSLALPSEGSFALEDLEKRKPGIVDSALGLLLADTRSSSALPEILARRLERNAATLAAQLSVTTLTRVLGAIAKVLRAGPAVLEAAPVVAVTLDAVLRACPKAHLGRALAALDDASLGTLVARLDGSVLPVDAERAWAQLLVSSKLAAAKTWAAPRASTSETPRPIGTALKAQLEACAPKDLPLMASVFLREPLLGLTDVVAARELAASKGAVVVAALTPSARLASALLACHDPPHLVADAFQQVITEEPAFLAAIDQALLDEDTRRDLPLLATAWVHHDPGHSVRFEHHCRSAPGGLRSIIELALALPCPILSWKVMRALVEVVRAWTFQRKVLLEKMDAKLGEILIDVIAKTAVPRPPTRVTSTFAGARAVRRSAAELIALAHGSGKAEPFITWVRARLIELAPDVESDIRDMLQPVAEWKRPATSAATEGAAPAPSDPSLDALKKKLRSVDAHAARAAVDELAKLGADGAQAISDALASNDPPLCLKAIIERAIFDDDAARRLVGDGVDPEVRFRVAMRLDDGKAALAAAASPPLKVPGRPWLTAEDVTALAAKVTDRAFAYALATSPHPPAYTKAVWTLLSQFHDATPKDTLAADDLERARMLETRAPIENALRSFLEVDDARETSLRAEVAAALIEGAKTPEEPKPKRSKSAADEEKDPSGWGGFGLDWWGAWLPRRRDPGQDVMTMTVAPVVFGHVLHAAAVPRHEQMLREAISNDLWREVIASAELAGDGTLNGALEEVMDKRQLDDELLAAIALMLLKQGVDKDDARPLFAVIRRARFFAEENPNIERLRESVQWGIRQARILLGRPVSVEMIHDAFGYTKLTQPRIYINPLPLLRGERGGDDVVRGLMVHEIGHHLYHADELGRACWEEARKEGIQGLLNLVADEHLERNLRAENEVYGDHLKVLAAYAFQHVSRDVWVEHMLNHLGRDAAVVLPNVTLMPGKSYGCVQVELGRLLGELSNTTSFARFMRALRMGLGARDEDPKVKMALDLFEKTRGKQIGFRASKMDWLLEIARELKRIFGDETKILETFGLHETMEASEGDLMEEGFSPDELQRELDKNNRKPPQKLEKPKWNDGPDEAFDLIDEVVALPHDPVAHRAIAEQGRLATKVIRRIFDDMGSKIIVEHRRLSGRSLDRQGLQSAILKMDPRLLVRRKAIPAADLFVGIVVDCSGSMASEQSMDKARVFATSLAEAARGRAGIDVKVFGFTDSIIYEAGTADRCSAHALTAGGGNNDSAGLWHAAVHAKRSKRKKKLLVMVSDGLPTECSASSLRNLALRLERGGMLTAQVAVRPISTQLFKHYVEILDDDIDDAARRFAKVITRLVRKTLGR